MRAYGVFVTRGRCGDSGVDRWRGDLFLLFESVSLPVGSV